MSYETELVDLRSRITRLEAQVDFLYRRFGLTYSDDQALANDDPAVIDALQTVNLIEAIKVYRQIHNVGLVEAKTAVEDLKYRLGL